MCCSVRPSCPSWICLAIPDAAWPNKRNPRHADLGLTSTGFQIVLSTFDNLNGSSRVFPLFGSHLLARSEFAIDELADPIGTCRPIQ